MWIYEQEGLDQKNFRTVLRANGETDTTPVNIQVQLQPDGDPEFQLLVFCCFLSKDCTVIFLFIFVNNAYVIKFFIYLFSKLLLSLRAIVYFLNLDDTPELTQFIEGLK